MDEDPREPQREPDRAVRWAGRIARILDDLYVDGIAGLLFPWGGDAVTSGTGLYLVAVAIQKKLPPVVIARMMLNLALDLLVGLIPIAGDLFDFAFKANKRNLRLLEARHQTGRASPADWIYVGLAAVALLAAFAAPIVLLIWAFREIF